jgi:prepilin-type N-terminal cleavage/methylation domain-containing protein
MFKIKRHRSGFTLIELLVVIAIIGRQSAFLRRQYFFTVNSHAAGYFGFYYRYLRFPAGLYLRSDRLQQHLYYCLLLGSADRRRQCRVAHRHAGGYQVNQISIAPILG